MLAKRAGDIAQLYTQKSFMRAYAVELILCGFDEERGPQLYKVDPAGHVLGYFGASSGTKEDDALLQLERAHKENGGFQGMEVDQVMRTCINALQNTIGREFKSDDIEIGYVDQNMVFKTLPEEKIAEYLKIIQKFL